MLEVAKAIFQIGAWLAQFKSNKDWAGGGITITFAGHGKDKDGSLVLEDGEITYSDLHDLLTRISFDNRLKVDLILDSCYSGKFIVDFLYAAESSKKIITNYLASACMHDETAMEDPLLGHGVFAYCFSAPKNRIGLYSGAMGCSMLTSGKQNPVIIDYTECKLCGKDFPVFNDEEFNQLISKDELYYRLDTIRYEYKRSINKPSYCKSA
nr:hypothetical protein [uncultured Bacillus sp.]